MSFHQRHYRLSLITLAIISFTGNASQWNFNDGKTHQVDTGYTSTQPDDIPLSASGENTRIEVKTPMLQFSTASEKTHAIDIQEGASLELNAGLLTTQGDGAFGMDVSGNSTVTANGGMITTHGNDAHGIKADNSQIDLTDVRVSTSGQDAHGIKADNSQITLTDVTLSASGTKANGVMVSDSDVQLNNVTVTASGQNAIGVESVGGSLDFSGRVSSRGGYSGVAVSNTHTRLHDLIVDLMSPDALAGISIDNSDLTADHLTVTLKSPESATPSSAFGIVINNQEPRSVRISDSTIRTQNGTGIKVFTGSAELNGMDVMSGGASALHIQQDAQATVRGGYYQSDAATATLYLSGDNSSLDAQDTSLAALGDGSSALFNRGAGGRISASHLTVRGENGYGIFTKNGTLNGDNLVILATGNHASGASAVEDATLNLSNSRIVMQGDDAVGLRTDSQIIADHLTVETSGRNATALISDGGELMLHSSNLTTKGADAAGLYISQRSTVSPGYVTLDYSWLTSDRGVGILAAGSNTEVLLKNDSQLRGAEHAAIAQGGSNLNISADNNSRLYGKLLADELSQLSLTLSDRSLLDGATSNVSSLKIDDSSRWIIRDDSTVHHLAMNGRAGFSAHNDGFKTLTVLNDLSGSGVFTLNTQLGDDSSPTDRLTVKGNASGDFKVRVSNKGGNGAETAKGIPLVHVEKDASGARFTQQGEIGIGNYEYFLNQVSENDWYLQASYTPDPIDPEPTPEPEPEPDPETPPGPGPAPDPGQGEGGSGGGNDGSGGSGGNGGHKPKPVPTLRREIGGYQINPWLNADYGFTIAGNWHQRQGVVRSGEPLWGRTWGQHQQLGSSRYSYRVNTFFMQFGSDVWQQQNAHGDRHTAGVMATLGTLHSGAEDRLRLLRPGLSASTGSISTTAGSIGGYYTFSSAQHYWLDLVAQQTFYHSTFESLSNAHQNSSGTLFSAEAGRPFALSARWQLEPQLQLMGQWLHSGSTGAQGVQVKSSDQMLALARAGLRLSYQAGAVEPWLQGDMFQRAGQIKGAKMAGLTVDPDLQSTWWAATAGINGKLSDRLDVYAEARYSHSTGQGREGYGGNLGLKVRF